MLAYANFKLVRALAGNFCYRPSLPKLVTLYSQVFTAALVAERVEDLELEDVFPQMSASVGGGFMSFVPGMQVVVTSVLQGMGSAFLTLRTGYLAEEYIMRGAGEFDRGRERRSANKRAARELLGVVAGAVANLPSSMRTLLRTVKLFKEPARQN